MESISYYIVYIRDLMEYGLSIIPHSLVTHHEDIEDGEGQKREVDLVV